MPILLCIGLLPFMQVGLSYYASTQVIIAAIILSSGNITALFSRSMLLRIFVAYGIFVMPMLYQGGFNNSDLARSFREAVAFFLISGAASMTCIYGERHQRSWLNAIFILSIALLALVVAQIAFLSRGIYFGLPQDWFVINTATLPDELDLLYSKLRPTATYGEPSYAAVVCFVLMFGVGPLYKTSGKARLTIIILFVTVLLTRAMSGIISCSLLFVYYRLQRDRALNALLLTGALLLLPVLLTVTETAISARFGAMLRGEDYSFNARILTPLMSMPQMLHHYPFGIPGKQMSEMAYVPELLIVPGHLNHNAALNMINSNGFFGIFMAVVLFFQYRSLRYSYLIAVLMMQNGTFFAFDKFSLVALAIILYRNFEGVSVRNRDAPHITVGEHSMKPAPR